MARTSMRFLVVLLLAPTIVCVDSSKVVGMDFTKIILAVSGETSHER